jgi:hypothetical protein
VSSCGVRLAWEATLTGPALRNRVGRSLCQPRVGGFGDVSLGRIGLMDEAWR